MGKLRSESQRSLQSERQSAVDKAWAAEVELIRAGKGTRQWTVAEQKELLGTGRVEGYHGHHMQSVKTHPENAGNKDNIQFLSYDEHINGAHKGNTRNSTDGYYDPQTGQMHEFKDGKLAPITPMEQKDQAFENAADRENAYRQGLIDRFIADKDQKLANYEKKLTQRDDLSEQEKADRYKAMSEKYESDKQDYANRILGNEKSEASDDKVVVNTENKNDSKSSVSVVDTIPASNDLIDISYDEKTVNDGIITNEGEYVSAEGSDSISCGEESSSSNTSSSSIDSTSTAGMSESTSSSSTVSASGGLSSGNGGGMDY